MGFKRLLMTHDQYLWHSCEFNNSTPLIAWLKPSFSSLDIHLSQLSERRALGRGVILAWMLERCVQEQCHRRNHANISKIDAQPPGNLFPTLQKNVKLLQMFCHNFKRKLFGEIQTIIKPRINSQWRTSSSNYICLTCSMRNAGCATIFPDCRINNQSQMTETNGDF